MDHMDNSTQTKPAPHVALPVSAHTVMDVVALLRAATNAVEALDRFIQLHDPHDADVAALLELQNALLPFHYRAPAQ